jgi:hypothetical protein
MRASLSNLNANPMILVTVDFRTCLVVARGAVVRPSRDDP